MKKLLFPAYFMFMMSLMQVTQAREVEIQPYTLGTNEVLMVITNPSKVTFLLDKGGQALIASDITNNFLDNSGDMMRARLENTLSVKSLLGKDGQTLQDLLIAFKTTPEARLTKTTLPLYSKELREGCDTEDLEGTLRVCSQNAERLDLQDYLIKSNAILLKPVVTRDDVIFMQTLPQTPLDSQALALIAGEKFKTSCLEQIVEAYPSCEEKVDDLSREMIPAMLRRSYFFLTDNAVKEKNSDSYMLSVKIALMHAFDNVLKDSESFSKTITGDIALRPEPGPVGDEVAHAITMQDLVNTLKGLTRMHAPAYVMAKKACNDLKNEIASESLAVANQIPANICQ